MSDDKSASPAAGLLEAIRARSAEARLSRLSELAASHPEADGPAELIARAEQPDILCLIGSAETYYFSETSMTQAYARHLFRVEERDVVKLIVETVRDESRIYPRPTAARAFLEAPFKLKPGELEAALFSIKQRPDAADIRESRASNGELYLYSADHLSAVHADGLVEWIEVQQKENP